jgi:hypothetical protein
MKVMVMIARHVIGQPLGGTGKALEPLSESGGAFQHHDTAFDCTVVLHVGQITAAEP